MCVCFFFFVQPAARDSFYATVAGVAGPEALAKLPPRHHSHSPQQGAPPAAAASQEHHRASAAPSNGIGRGADGGAVSERSKSAAVLSVGLRNRLL